MGQCLWGKQSSSEARAEGSVTNVASLHADQCGHLEASRRCTYTDSTERDGRTAQWDAERTSFNVKVTCVICFALLCVLLCFLE